MIADIMDPSQYFLLKWRNINIGVEITSQLRLNISQINVFVNINSFDVHFLGLTNADAHNYVAHICVQCISNSAYLCGTLEIASKSETKSNCFL